LYDLQRIRAIDGDHEEMGAIEAGKTMKTFGYSKEMIDLVTILY